MAESTQDVISDAITQPTKMAEYPNAGTSSIVEEMRKTGTMTKVEQAERLEEIVHEAA